MTHDNKEKINKPRSIRFATDQKEYWQEKSILLPNLNGHLRSKTEAKEASTSNTKPMAKSRMKMGLNWAMMLGRGSI